MHAAATSPDRGGGGGGGGWNDTTAKRSSTDAIRFPHTKAREAMIRTLTEQLYRTIPESDRQSIAECLRIIWRYVPDGVSVTSLQELEKVARNLNLGELRHKHDRICMTNIMKYLHNIRSAAQSIRGWWWWW